MATWTSSQLQGDGANTDKWPCYIGHTRIPKFLHFSTQCGKKSENNKHLLQTHVVSMVLHLCYFYLVYMYRYQYWNVS